MGKIKEHKNGEVIKNNILYIEEAGYFGGRRFCKFRCHCGNDFVARINDIKTGKIISCKCIQKTNRVKTNQTIKKKHGDSNGCYYLYAIWNAIKYRCYNKNNSHYKYYGERGIIMFPEWIDNYPLFKEYILTNLGERPDSYLIDRIDNDGNYEPNNLRWVTPSESNKNRRGWSKSTS